MQRNAHPATASGKKAETKASPPMLPRPTERMTPPQSMQPAFCPVVFVSPCPPTGSVTRLGLATCVDRAVLIDAPSNAECSPAVPGLPMAYASAPTIDSFVANPINLFTCFSFVSEVLLIEDGRVACRAASRQRQCRSGDPDGCHPPASGNQCGSGGDASQAGRDRLPALAVDIGHLDWRRSCGPRCPKLPNSLRPQQQQAQREREWSNLRSFHFYLPWFGVNRVRDVFRHGRPGCYPRSSSASPDQVFLNPSSLIE